MTKAKKSAPSPNGDNGTHKSVRETSGRFAVGNPGGPGNPHARHIGQLRSTMLAGVTAEDMAAIVARLVTLAKGGELAAIREVMDRVLGRPVEADLIERLEALERAAAGLATEGTSP